MRTIPFHACRSERSPLTCLLAGAISPNAFLQNTLRPHHLPSFCPRLPRQHLPSRRLGSLRRRNPPLPRPYRRLLRHPGASLPPTPSHAIRPNPLRALHSRHRFLPVPVPSTSPATALRCFPVPPSKPPSSRQRLRSSAPPPPSSGSYPPAATPFRPPSREPTP